MIRRGAICLAILPALLFGLRVAAAAEGGSEFLLAGNEKALWLVRKGTEAFDIVAKPTGEAWQWVMENRPGGPAAACASQDLLYILFPSGDFWSVSRSGQGNPRLKPTDARWPAGSQSVILVGAADSAGAQNAPLLAIVPRPAKTGAGTRPSPPSKPATQPAKASVATRAAASATSPASGQLTVGIFKYTQNGWSHLTDMDAAISEDQASGVRAALADGSLHVYVPGLEGIQSLALPSQSPWKSSSPYPAELSSLLATGEALALLAMQEKLVLIVARGRGDAAGSAVHLAILQGQTWRVQQVMRDGEPAAWPASRAILASRFAADQIALVCPKDDTLDFASCDIAGRLTLREEVKIFEKPPPDVGRAQEIYEYFMWGLLIAAVVPMFLIRPRAGRGPFALPQRRLPGGLIRRLLAAILDAFPCSLISVAIFHPPLPGEPLGDVRRFREITESYVTSVEGAYASIAFAVLFVAYCTVMEARFGATGAKMLLKLRVVNDAGQRPSLREAFLRNLFKIIEISMPFGVPLLLLLPLINRNRQRLGDMLARTAVINTARLAPPPPEPPGGDSGN